MPQTNTVASPPSPNQLFFSRALTCSEISSRSPDAATLARFTVRSTAPEPFCGKVLPANCASSIRSISVNGVSIGALICTPASSAGTMASVAGNGHSGLVCAAVTRVSVAMPSVSVKAPFSIFGCAASARVGRSSSHSPCTATPCSGIERHSRVHSCRALRSSAPLLRMRCCSCAICSLIALSIIGLTCAGTLTRTPATATELSPSTTCAVRLGSICQFCVSVGRAVIARLPLMSALALNALMLTPIRSATLPPSSLPSASFTAPCALPESAPFTASVPEIGAARPSWFCAPAALMAPRVAVQLMSASCNNCGSGLAALPAKFFGAVRSTTSRIALSGIEIGITSVEVRAPGNAGSGASVGALAATRRGDSES